MGDAFIGQNDDSSGGGVWGGPDQKLIGCLSIEPFSQPPPPNFGGSIDPPPSHLQAQHAHQLRNAWCHVAYRWGLALKWTNFKLYKRPEDDDDADPHEDEPRMRIGDM